MIDTDGRSFGALTLCPGHSYLEWSIVPASNKLVARSWNRRRPRRSFGHSFSH
jgi:hypothetical protein